MHILIDDHLSHTNERISDVGRLCLEAARNLASRQPRVSKSAASALPRRFDASPLSWLGLNVMTTKLRYDITSHKFHPFIFCT